MRLAIFFASVGRFLRHRICRCPSEKNTMADEKTKLPLSAIPSSYRDIVVDLPLSYYRNVGKVITAHAFLEGQVLDTLCVLSGVGTPVGQVVLRYQAASERFKTVVAPE